MFKKATMFKNVFTLCLLLTYSTFVFTGESYPDSDIVIINNTDTDFSVIPTEKYTFRSNAPDCFRTYTTTPSSEIVVSAHETYRYSCSQLQFAQSLAALGKESLILRYEIKHKGRSITTITRVLSPLMLKTHREVTIEYPESGKDEIIIITR